MHARKTPAVTVAPTIAKTRGLTCGTTWAWSFSILAAAIACGVVAGQEPSASEHLQRAISLYDHTDYQACHEALAVLPETALDADQRRLRDQYLEWSANATAQVRAADEALELARVAISDGRYAEAEGLLSDVLKNQFARDVTKGQAETELSAVARLTGSRSLRLAAAQDPLTFKDLSRTTPPTTTTSGTAQQVNNLMRLATDAMNRGDDRAARNYIDQALRLMPGHPPALEAARMLDARSRGTTVTSPTPPPPPPSPSRPSGSFDFRESQSFARPAAPESTFRPIPSSPVTAPTMSIGNRSAQAAELIRMGTDALNRGDNLAARRYLNQALGLVPGHPDAVNALEQLRLHDQIERTPSDIRLLDQMQQRRDILWQRAVASFRHAESQVQSQVSDDNYDDANQVLLFARETIESAKQYARPYAKYESIKAEYDALAEMLAAKDKAYNEDKALRIRTDLELREDQRQAAVEADRQRQVDLLMEQVEQKQLDGDFDGAVAVLRQITVIDPGNTEAEWLSEQLRDLASVRRQNLAKREKELESREILIQAEEAKVPWHKTLNYPDNWNELIRSPYRRIPGEYPIEAEESEFEESFRERIPEVSFDDTRFDEAIRHLADASGMNLVPNWPDLAANGVTKDTLVTLHLRNVPVQTALQELIEQAESAAQARIRYQMNDTGIVKVATDNFLDRDVFARVYYVNDLIHPAEDYEDAPEFDLRKTYRNRSNPDRAFPDDEAYNEENLPIGVAAARNEHMQDLVDLIRAHAMPGSWQSQGGAFAKIHARSDGNLVVTQTARGHQEVFNLLDQLREDNAVQIAIEARFLTVNHNFLEDMGIDLNIVLNAGNAGFDPGFVAGSAAFDPASGGRLLLPRNFTRLGFGPATPGFGTALANVATPDQPYSNPAFVPSATGSSNNWTPIPINSGVTSYTDPAQLLSDVPGSFAGRELPPALQIAGAFLDNIQLDFLIRATQADSRTNTLIAPKLVMTNGQQSWIAITEQQNYVSELDPVVASGAAAQRPITNSLDTGAVLNVQAVVSPDKRYVTMNLQPGVGRLVAINTFQFTGGPITGVGTSGFIQLPIIQRQQVKTTATVPDGGTLLIGGQKLTFETEVESGVPVLSKIPVLKRLYSSRATVKDEQVLLILIKPEILIKEEQEELANPTLGSLR